jgi:hypothetical protein
MSDGLAYSVLPRRIGRVMAAESFWRSYRAELSRFRYLYAFVVFYFFLSAALSYGFGHADMVHPLGRLFVWVPGLAAFGGIYIAFFEIPKAVWIDERPALQALRANLTALVTPYLLAGITLFFAIVIFFGSFTTLKTLASEVVGFHADPALAWLDRAIHFGRDPWEWLQPILGHHLITRTIQKFYVGGWFACLMGFCGSIALVPSLAHLRARFFLAFVMCWVILGNVLAAIFMSGGPAYYDEITGDVARYGKLFAYHAFSRGLDQSSVDLQDILWQIYAAHQSGLASGISAFPSLHVAMSTLYTLTAFQIDRRLGFLTLGYALVVVLGSVHLGWHYAVDGYFSFAAVLFIWWLAGRLTQSGGAGAA